MPPVPPLGRPTNRYLLAYTYSQDVMGENAERRYALLVNDSDSVIYLALGQAAALNSGIRLNANGGWYEMIDGMNLWTGVVNAITATGTKRVVTVEA